MYISPFPSPLLSFYSSRLTVASHIPRILCSFCPLTAVCSREDPRDISSLVLFPSSLFNFYLIFLPFCSLCLLALTFSPVSCLFLTSLLFFFCIPFSFSFSFVHLFFMFPLNLFLFYFPSLKILASLSFLIFLCFCFFPFSHLCFLSPLSHFPKVTIPFLFCIPIFYFILLRTDFCSFFIYFSYFSVWLATFLGLRQRGSWECGYFSLL